MSTPSSSEAQRRSNVRLGLILASIALTFFAGFVIKTVFFGSH
ncbi:cytochrome oxidase small assembly protein [Aquabacterium sp. A3]